MGIKQLYNDTLRKLPNEYGDVSVMRMTEWCLVKVIQNGTMKFSINLFLLKFIVSAILNE